MKHTIRHISVSVRGAIGLPDSELKSWIGNIRDDDTGETIWSVRELRLCLAEMLAEGCEYIRNTECDNFDPLVGCLGHPVMQTRGSEVIEYERCENRGRCDDGEL